ncbi:CHASE sensor domain-containing protein [Opitutus sp. ER46]|uniref:CHASE sensor domain-containing protein n=1 Tax=Opitutus sp. ER46 TaxID=2161864 RepID=UPI000D2F9F8D|nr:CHASE sensor domain-containing protein [Opitutus sp. ER46]PTX91068.1 hypothetical protein DB354_20745 [Opitutus sp. ER46]
MRQLHDLPIRRKLALIDMATTAAAVLLACGILIFYEQFTFRKTMVHDLSITAQMIATNTASALSFDDALAAREILQALTAQPHIMAACVFTPGGRVFAEYQRRRTATPDWPAPKTAGATFDDASLRLFHPITLGGEVIGTLYVQSDLVEVSTRWRRYLVVGLAILAGAMLVSFLLGSRLQRMISGPVSLLSDAIAKVTAGQQTSTRVTKLGNDELGRLTDGFNHMLARIEARESDLRKAQAELERRVQERTRELSIQISERERTEEERDRFFTLSLDLFCIAEFDGTLRRTNPAFAIFGYDPARLEGLNYLDFVAPEDVEASRENLRKLADGEPILNRELRMSCADGVIRWFAWTAIAAPGEGIFFACGRDVTDQKRAETEREQLHRKLLETSRRAGMAEVATSVLHNVGNVLNSVNVSATVLDDKIRDSRIELVTELSALFQEHAHDLADFLTRDPRGREIPQFVQMLASHLAEVCSGVTRELESLRKNVDHIKEIVAMQQNYARVSGVIENVSVIDLVEDAVQMNAGGLQRHAIHLHRNFTARPRVSVDKHKVLQILVNIIRNAKYACTESGRPDRHVTIDVATTPQTIRIAVTDNGVGILPENRTRIFSHGFTTRQGGHGFGLHSGAIAAKELGGAIEVHSDGPGQGARFTLVLPYEPQDQPT